MQKCLNKWTESVPQEHDFTTVSLSPIHWPYPLKLHISWTTDVGAIWRMNQNYCQQARIVQISTSGIAIVIAMHGCSLQRRTDRLLHSDSCGSCWFRTSDQFSHFTPGCVRSDKWTVPWFVGASRAWRLYSQITPVPDARLSGTNTLNILIYFFLPTERVLLELSWTYYRQKIP